MKCSWIDWKQSLGLKALLVVAICGMSMIGCAVPQTGQPLPAAVSRPHGAEQRALSEGIAVFAKGEYEKAMALFETLNETAQDPEVNRKALFGFASTRLLLARSQTEFGEAMRLMECWMEKAPVELGGEDPRLLVPLLVRLPFPSSEEAARSKPPKSNKDLVYNTLVACRNSLQAKEKEVERVKSRLDAKDREIRRLKGQLESLEAIHRKFQEKKQEVSTP
jgi:hypothetical protein